MPVFSFAFGISISLVLSIVTAPPVLLTKSDRAIPLLPSSLLHALAFHDRKQVRAVVAGRRAPRQDLERVERDEAGAVGNLLRTADLEPGAGFHDANELACLEQVGGGAAVEPSVAASEGIHLEAALRQVSPIDVRDFELTALRGRELGRDLHHVGSVEVEAGDRVTRGRVPRLLDDRHRPAGGIEIDRSERFRVGYLVDEHTGAVVLLGGMRQHAAEPSAE